MLNPAVARGRDGQRLGIALEPTADCERNGCEDLGVVFFAPPDRYVMTYTAFSDRGPRVALALAIYLHRLRAGIAQMAAAMGGVDALAFLGVTLDASINERSTEDEDLSLPSGSTRVLLVRAREDLEVARATRRILTSAS